MNATMIKTTDGDGDGASVPLVYRTAGRCRAVRDVLESDYFDVTVQGALETRHWMYLPRPHGNVYGLRRRRDEDVDV